MSNIRFLTPSARWARTMLFMSSVRPRWCTRGLHNRRALLYKLEDGLGDFLPPPALKSIAVDWQQGLLERLNDEVKDTEDEGQSLAKTVIGTAGHEDKMLAFNYASLALNNGFFLDHLKPPPSPGQDHSEHISTHLLSQIQYHYGGLAQFKSEFSAAAMGMFTSGWVWFVCNKNGEIAIFPTYGPGTLLVRSQTYMASAKGLSFGDALDDAIHREGDEVDYGFQYESGDIFNVSDPSDSPDPPSTPHSAVRQPTSPGVTPSSPLSGVAGSREPSGRNPLHPRSYSTTVENEVAESIYKEPIEEPLTKTDLLDAAEQILFPLCCVSVHEHAWMAAGYGIWGKEEWLKKFWTVLDWEKVSKSYDAIVKAAKQQK